MLKPLKPEIVEAPARKMAVATTKGDPGKAVQGMFPALYGSVYTLKFDLRKKGL